MNTIIIPLKIDKDTQNTNQLTKIICCSSGTTYAQHGNKCTGTVQNVNREWTECVTFVFSMLVTSLPFEKLSVELFSLHKMRHDC